MRRRWVGAIETIGAAFPDFGSALGIRASGRNSAIENDRSCVHDLRPSLYSDAEALAAAGGIEIRFQLTFVRQPRALLVCPAASMVHGNFPVPAGCMARTYIRPASDCSGVVVRTLACHTGELGSIHRRGPSRVFACRTCARKCRWSAGFLGDLPFPSTLYTPTMLHARLAPPASALNSSITLARYIAKVRIPITCASALTSAWIDGVSQPSPRRVPSARSRVSTPGILRLMLVGGDKWFGRTGSAFLPLAPPQRVKSCNFFKTPMGRGGVVVRLLTFHLGERGSIHGQVAPGFSRVGIVSDDVTGCVGNCGDLPDSYKTYSSASHRVVHPPPPSPTRAVYMNGVPAGVVIESSSAGTLVSHAEAPLQPLSSLGVLASKWSGWGRTCLSISPIVCPARKREREPSKGSLVDDPLQQPRSYVEGRVSPDREQCSLTQNCMTGCGEGWKLIDQTSYPLLFSPTYPGEIYFGEANPFLYRLSQPFLVARNRLSLFLKWSWETMGKRNQDGWSGIRTQWFLLRAPSVCSTEQATAYLATLHHTLLMECSIETGPSRLEKQGQERNRSWAEGEPIPAFVWSDLGETMRNLKQGDCTQN
ncbi:hypothetical protein PR048_024006 [Dryococelus australis]|uniref:Uncharacterized protein n=1 Tax=Dryococelus australis TaxID=614101 RepID=A0ABQ9GVR2_9NEOP|nr:hypothetical protein PR048_024006 [Dryococelus australis]